MILPGFVVTVGPALAQTPPAPQALFRLATPAGAAGFGHAIAGIDDVDGDGTGDVVVTAPGVDRAFVMSGATGTVLHELVTAPSPNLEFGAAVAAIGDIDGDGVADVAVGAPADRTIVPAPAGGRVFLFSGTSGAMLRQLAPAVDHPDFGRSVAGPGDISGDGLPDVVTGGGPVVAFSGANGGLLWSRPEPSTSPGQVLAATPDVTGDGVADVLASAPGVQPAPAAGQVTDLLTGVLHRVLTPAVPGRVDVLSGSTGAVARTVADPAPHDSGAFGGSVVAVGDQDGDGVVDHFIGEHGANLLHLYSGDDGVLIRSVAAPSTVQGQAFALAHVSDHDGDGRDDIWVGVGPARGAYLVNGMGALIRWAAGPSPQGSFGASVAPAGGDVVIGDPTEPGGGAAYVVRAVPRASTAAGAIGETPLRTRAQTSNTTTTSTTVSTTSSIPATAVLPKPAAVTADASSLATTGAHDRSGPGLLALALGAAGTVILRRAHRTDG